MDEIERFIMVTDFPNYQVSNFGRVFNVVKEKEMVQSANQNSEWTVGLSRQGRQYRRSVKVLVAKGFCPGSSWVMDTVVQLDGDRDNLHASNLVWRPRWFAWKYNGQFNNVPEWAWVGPIKDDGSGGEYENMVEAAMVLGVLIPDIRQSMRTGAPVFPHGMTFSFF